jgi:hypothetical protein
MSKKLTVLAILALFLSASAFAQQVPSAKMMGKVVDTSGAPLPGVAITATSPKMVGKATAVTDGEGFFRLFSLPSGLYEVTFSLQGFKTLIRKEIIVQLSQTITLNATMDQAALEEQVTVIGQSPLIDVKSTVKGMTITKELFMSLPRNRSFDGLINTIPGVQSDFRTGGLSVDGATGSENMWYMDGADVSNVHVGTSSQGAVMEMIEEVKVTASGYNAEFGGGMGGVVNVITRSGGNSFHGDILAFNDGGSMLMVGKANTYFRWSPTDSNIPQYVNDDDLYFNGGRSRDDYKRFEGVFNIGGYILKDRLWFFTSFNPVYSRTFANRFFNSDRVVPTDPLPLYPFYRKDLAMNGSVKLTAAPLKGLRLSASAVDNWSNYRGSIPSILGSDQKTFTYGLSGRDYPNWSAAFTADYSASNNFLVSLRGGYHQHGQKNEQIGPKGTTIVFNLDNLMFGAGGAKVDPFFVANPSLVRIAGAANYAGPWTKYDHQKFEKYSTNLDLSYYVSMAGEHAFKAGAQFIRDVESQNDGSSYPHVNINWDQESAALEGYGVPPFRGTYGNYEIISGWNSPYGYTWDAHRDAWAVYLQDSWTINGKLTVNAGLRTETEYIPSFSTAVEPENMVPIKFHWAQKFAPRLGAVYDVFGDSSLKVFGSFGIYYDVMKMYIAEGAFGGYKWSTDYYKLDNPDWRLIGATNSIPDRASQEAGGTYMGHLDWRIPSFDTLEPDMKPVGQRELSLGVEKKLTEDISASVRFVQKHLIRTIEDIGVGTAGGESYYEGNPGSAWIVKKFNELQPPIQTGPGTTPPAGWTYPAWDTLPAGTFNYWPQVKAKREYYAMNVDLVKRFSHNWQGGLNYTLSLTKGNYGGLSSTDEFGRNSPNVERSFDLWFMMYQIDGTPVDGVLPQDRTHYIKAYGSYSFPIGLTIGVTSFARSGNPMSSRLPFTNSYFYPDGYADLGRLPWTIWGDVFAEWAIKIGGKYTIALNAQINNIANTRTWQHYRYAMNRQSGGMSIPDIYLLNGEANNPDTTYTTRHGAGTPSSPYTYRTVYWRDRNQYYRPDVTYAGFESSQFKYNNQFGRRSLRLGARFTF